MVRGRDASSRESSWAAGVGRERGKVDELHVIPEMAIRARARSRAARSRDSVRRRRWLPAGRVRRHPGPLGYPNEGIVPEEKKKSTVRKAPVSPSIFLVFRRRNS